VPVYPLIGDGARSRVRRLALDPRLSLVRSPRHATVLLVAGPLAEALVEPACLLHDQIPPPRGTVFWSNTDPSALPFPAPLTAAEDADPAPTLIAAHRALLAGDRASAPTILPTENPVRWRGVGPHGQGGDGMMGGTPYGRPMAMTGDDLRDGLQLDRVQLTIGPFLPWLPGGLSLDVVLQGDVVQELRARVPDLERRDEPEIFQRAAHQAVAVADLELARARHHLEATADMLTLHGLEALAERTLRLASRVDLGSAGEVRRLARVLHKAAALRIGTAGVGVLPAARLGGLGPIARAAGWPDDARASDPAYAALDFTVITHTASDANARWRQRLAEAAQALDMARRAGNQRREPGPPLEGPRGALREESSPLWLDLLKEVAVGQAWDALATTVASLDLDPAMLPPQHAHGGGERNEAHGHEDRHEDGHDCGPEQDGRD
jgi:hypothetical protein